MRIVDWFQYRLPWMLRHPRCTLLGCKWGDEDDTQYEAGVLYSAWATCVRCGCVEETYSCYGGVTPFGRSLGR